MRADRFLSRASAALLLWAVVVCLALSPAAGAKVTGEELPTLEAVLAQDFYLSVITASHGAFNASLRVKGSLNFPDRIHGELVPLGEPVLQEGQAALPCFSRERDFTDDKYAPPLPAADTSGKDKRSKEAAERKASVAAAMGVERPTLLVFDIKLHHSNSPRGSLTVFALPADQEAMVDAREAIQEGAAVPAFTATFLFRSERAAMAGSILSDIPALARVASSVLSSGADATTNAKTLEDTPDAEGDFTLRIFSEHEFTLALHIPIAAEKPTGDEAEGQERVWVHGYTEPNPRVYARRQHERPWWHLPGMLAIGTLTSLVQVLTGVSDGQKKGAERRALEEAAAAREKSQIEEKKDK